MTTYSILVTNIAPGCDNQIEQQISVTGCTTYIVRLTANSNALGPFNVYVDNDIYYSAVTRNDMLDGVVVNIQCTTPTPTQTPTVTPTPSITPTNTVTPSITPTNTATPTVTPTNTTTPTNTPTPSSTPLIFEVQIITQDGQDLITQDGNPLIVQQESECWILYSAPFGGCSVQYINQFGSLVTTNIPPEDAGLCFTICVNQMISDSCGFVSLGVNCGDVSCDCSPPL
jgi:hypothetical protein